MFPGRVAGPSSFSLAQRDADVLPWRLRRQRSYIVNYRSMLDALDPIT